MKLNFSSRVLLSFVKIYYKTYTAKKMFLRQSIFKRTRLEMNEGWRQRREGEILQNFRNMQFQSSEDRAFVFKKTFFLGICCSFRHENSSLCHIHPSAAQSWHWVSCECGEWLFSLTHMTARRTKRHTKNPHLMQKLELTPWMQKHEPISTRCHCVHATRRKMGRN